MTDSNDDNKPGLTPSKVLNFKVLGRSGLQQSGGRIYQELHPKLRGILGPRLFREMADNDAIIGAVLYAIKTWTCSAPWRIEPSDEHDPEALEWAEFVESCMADMSHTFEDFLWELFGMYVYGWSLAETVYKRRMGPSSDPTRNSKFTDGRIGWRKLSFRHQQTLDRWEFDVDGGVQGMWQRPPIGSPIDWNSAQSIIFLPIEKCLLFRTETNIGNPEGRSMLRNSVTSYLKVRRLQDTEATGAERDLTGYPVLEVPPDLLDPTAPVETQQMLAEMQQMVQDVRRDEREGAVIPCEMDPTTGKPTGYKFRLMSSGGTRVVDLDKVIRRYESRMAMSLLAEFVLVGLDKGGGSYALHDSKTDAFALSLKSMLERVAAIFNRFAIPRLCALNGCPADKYPTAKHGDVSAPPLADIVQYVSGLSTAGMLMYDKKLERKLRELGDLPEPDDETMPAADGLIEADDGTDEDITDDGVAQPTDATGVVPAPGPPAPGGPQPANPGQTPPAPAKPGQPPAAAAPAAPKAAAKVDVGSLMQIVAAVGARELPRASAVAIMVAAYGFTPEQADGIIGEVGDTFTPESAQPPEDQPEQLVDTEGELGPAAEAALEAEESDDSDDEVIR